MELGPGGVAGTAAEAPCWQAGGMAAKLTSLAESLVSFLLRAKAQQIFQVIQIQKTED